MLRLILGRAGTGKTAAIISEIAGKVRDCRGRSILLVPEQYSHEAERELCSVCGDTLSLYAEVLSFTGLARSVAAEVGGGSIKYLDKGGRMLCMALAAGNAASGLKVYSAAGRSPELQSSLLDAVAELKTSCVGEDELYEAAAKCGEPGLADKLGDMARILGAYNALMAQGTADPGDRLTKLAGSIEKSSIGKGTDVYFDGFSGFSAQELRVIRALLEKNTGITVCLTADSLENDSDEVFAVARKTARILIAAAEELNIEYSVEYRSSKGEKDPAIEFYTGHMFGFLKAGYPGKTDAVRLYSADSVISECEFAAAESLRLVRECGCRWRDIAVAVRGFDAYASQLASCFEHYGVPLFMARKSAMASKPVPLLISTAYRLIEEGWDVDDMLSYLGTGLTGVSPEDADTLGTYVYLWQLHAPAWRDPDDWQQHPDGFGGEKDEVYREKIERINSIRRTVAGPLLRLEENTARAETADAQAKALARYLEDIRLAEIIEKHAGECEKAGKPELAAEYSQVWNIVVNALEQCAAVLGGMRTDTHSFSKLFVSMLSQYDIGTIPVSLDRVSAGDFDRMRRRSIRHLIVLGANDSALPRIDEQHGIFTGDDRVRMLEDFGIDLGGADDELWREFSLIYDCLSLPSESLTLSYCTSDGQDELRPSIVINSASSIFGIRPKHIDMRDVKSYAGAPALSLAANAFRTPDPALHAAKEYFENKAPEHLEKIRKAAEFNRGKLSPQAVKGIYGTTIRLSASKIDTFSKCRYEYFCRYGMEAQRFEPIGFKPPEIGTYVHEILEKTAKEVRDHGGWKAVGDEQLTDIADKYTAEYVHRELNDFKEKSGRFVHLFSRMRGEVLTIIREMAEELRASEFEPLKFEFNFADTVNNRIDPIVIGEKGEQMMLTGIADRIDGWLHDGRLYVRVVDYKTGTKTFALSDVWYGSGLQMLLYLYALTKNSSAVSDGAEVVPAGVMYLPAKVPSKAYDDVPDDEDVAADRKKEIRRSGIVMDDEELHEAWEHGEKKIYMPENTAKKKDFSATPEQFDLLFGHIVSYLADMSKKLHEGDIEANPLSAGSSSNACMMCDYARVCRFADGENSESYRSGKKLSAEDVWTLMKGENEDGE